MADWRRMGRWFLRPPSIISIFAFLISLISLVYPWLHTGTLEIITAENIAISLHKDGSGTVLVPIVFFNTGAPEHWKIIQDLDIQVKASSQEGSNYQTGLDWERTVRLISSEEYNKQYSPEKKEPLSKSDQTPPAGIPESRIEDVEQGNYQDFVLYEGRPIPFGVAGSQAVIKYCEFSIKEGASNILAPGLITIVVDAKIADGGMSKSSGKKYRIKSEGLQSVKPGDYTWVHEDSQKKSQ